nr:type IV secretory system conjugative DNA transfer family protein [uncultured Oscillibacter sp.]
MWQAAGGTFGTSPEFPGSGFFACIAAVFRWPYGLYGVGGCIAALGVLIFMVMRMGYSETGAYDQERNPIYSNKGTYGTAGFMTQKELKGVLDLVPNIRKHHGIILGEIDGEVICVPLKTRFNGNLAVYGASGLKKPRAFCMNMILQSAARRFSLIICDPKSELYEKSSAYLRDQGYTVKAFNLVPPAASDSWNCLSEIEGQELMSHMRGILTARLGSGIDFIVKGHENKSRSVAASRKGAMYRKCQSFYLDKDERGEPMIYEARVVAVAEKVVRVEVFGVECAILARGLSRAWAGDAAGHCHVGDRILVRVQKITGTTVEDLSISADVRSTSASTAADDLKKCVPQGRYAGRVIDVRGGVLYVRLNNGVNAIAHSCYDRRLPGKRDDVSFAVTRLDEEQGVVVGSITRIIKQNL